MATSGSVNTNTYGGRKITLTVSETGTSIENNTSTVTWTLTSGTSGTYHSVYNIGAFVNGEKVYGIKSADWDTRAFPCKDGSTSGTLTIRHNDDGTASNVSFKLQGSVFYNTSPIPEYTGSINLTTIPRASTFTLSKTSGGTATTSFSLGDAIWVNISRNSSSFTHKVYFVVNNSGNQTLSNSATTSANTTLANSLANYIPSTSASATMYVETYNGGTLVGSKSQTFTIAIPDTDTFKPSISSVTKSDTAGYLSTHGAYVQGKSDLRVQTSATANYSSLSSYTVNLKNSGGTILATKTGNDVTFTDINYTGTITVEVIVKDARGRSKSNTSTITVATYSAPTITTFTANRANNDATVTISYNASIVNINSHNSNAKTFKIYKRQKGTSSWGTAIATYTSSYSYSGSTTSSCDVNSGWEFKLDATDSFSTTSKTTEVGTTFELINWKADGTAMAVGKVSEKSNTFELGMKMVIPKGNSYGIYNSDNYPIIRDYGNQNITVDATGNALFLGFQNTPSINMFNQTHNFTTSEASWFSGKIKLNSNGLHFPETSYNGIYWKEGNYGDQFKIVPYFSGYDDGNELQFKGAVGDSGTSPSLYNLMTLTGKSGNMWVKGNIKADDVIRPSTKGIAACTGRSSTPNFDHQYPLDRANMRFDIVTSSMNSSGMKPPSDDGYLLTFFWDNSGTYDTQLYIPNGTAKERRLQIRSRDGGAWNNTWYDIPFSLSLYDNATGTNGEVTIGTSASVFSFLEIYYKDNNGKYGGYTKIYTPDGKYIDLSMVESTSSSTLIRHTRYYINSNKITPQTNNRGYSQINSSSVARYNVTSTNYIYIYKVVGIR